MQMRYVINPDIPLEEQLIGLMERYENDLLRMCCVCLRNTSLAEDAVQETFLKAYKSLNTFRSENDE